MPDYVADTTIGKVPCCCMSTFCAALIVAPDGPDRDAATLMMLRDREMGGGDEAGAMRGRIDRQADLNCGSG